MFDAFHTGSDGTLNALRGVDMRHHIGVPVTGNFNTSAQFAFGELGAVQRVVHGCNTATGQHLDL